MNFQNSQKKSMKKVETTVISWVDENWDWVGRAQKSFME
jgi:hypothetical protein